MENNTIFAPDEWYDLAKSIKAVLEINKFEIDLSYIIAFDEFIGKIMNATARFGYRIDGNKFMAEVGKFINECEVDNIKFGFSVLEKIKYINIENIKAD